MCMKSNGLSSKSTGRRHRLGCRMPLSVCTPRPHPPFCGKLVELTLAWRYCRPGNSATTVHCGGGQETAPGAADTPRNVKNEGTSGDVYENKWQGDNLPDTKDDISARLHAILQKSTPILQRLSAFCHYSGAGGRTFSFKLWRRQEPNAIRASRTRKQLFLRRAKPECY